MWNKKSIKIQVEVSARHCHLSENDLFVLFGKNHELKSLKQLSQPSEFACQETVEIEFGSKKISNVRVVGPAREKSQVEISITDSMGSGITPIIRLSGHIENSSPVLLRGPEGVVKLNEGLIVAKRHIHCATEEAIKLGLKNGDSVSVKIDGERPVIFEDVIVRVKNGYSLSMHLDTDEGNACGINKIGKGEIIK